MINPDIKVEYHLEGLKELQVQLVKLSNQDIDKALQVGFRRTAKSFPGYMAGAAAKFYNVKQRTLKNTIRDPRITPSTVGADIDIRSSGQPLSGRMFKPLHGVRHKDKRNASIVVFKGEKRKPRKNGFRNPAFARGGPFVRDTDARLPISKMTGPSFHHLFTGGKFHKGILVIVEQKGSDKLHNAVVDALRAKSRGFLK